MLFCFVRQKKRVGLISVWDSYEGRGKKNKIFFLVNDWLVLYWNSRFRLKFFAYQILMSIDLYHLLQFQTCKQKILEFLSEFVQRIGKKIIPYVFDIKVGGFTVCNYFRFEKYEELNWFNLKSFICILLCFLILGCVCVFIFSREAGQNKEFIHSSLGKSKFRNFYHAS